MSTIDTPAAVADPFAQAQQVLAGGAPDLAAQIAAAQQSGDTRLAIHLQNQKLAPQGR